MEAKWNNEKASYEFTFTTTELGALLYAMTIVKLETKDPDVTALQEAVKTWLDDESTYCIHCHTRDCSGECRFSTGICNTQGSSR